MPEEVEKEVVEQPIFFSSVYALVSMPVRNQVLRKFLCIIFEWVLWK